MRRLVFMRWTVLLALVLLVFSGCENSSSEPDTQAAPAGLIGAAAPDFTLVNMQGEEVSLSQLKGKVVVLNFWATWCPPCREEMPSMERLFQETKDKGLVMLAVNAENNGRTAVSRFLEKNPYDFTILLDPDAEVQNAYGVFRLPESFIIDRNGVVVEKIIGGRDWMDGSIYKKIDFLLNG